MKLHPLLATLAATGLACLQGAFADGASSSAFTSPVRRLGPEEPGAIAPSTNSVILLEAVTLGVTGWGGFDLFDPNLANLELNMSQVVTTPTILNSLPVSIPGDTDFTDPTATPGSSTGRAAVSVDLTTAHTVGIACGELHTLLLKRDGRVIGRGWNGVGQLDIPSDLTNAVAIACGTDHSLAIRRDGSVVAWGYWRYEQTKVPTDLGPAIAVAGGSKHSLALLADGTVRAWGYNNLGQLMVPEGLSSVTAIAAGADHNLALRKDGRVVAWGSNGSGETKVPAGLENVVGIAAGGAFSLALRADGHVVAWGASERGQTEVPADLENVVAIAAGNYHGVALLESGQVVTWGDNLSLSIQVPAGLSNVVAIAAGGFHVEALSQAVPPLTGLRRGTGGLKADLNLPAGWLYDVESSNDLQSWQPLRRSRVVPGEMTVEMPLSPASPGQFFRVVPASTLTVRFLRH